MMMMMMMMMMVMMVFRDWYYYDIINNEKKEKKKKKKKRSKRGKGYVRTTMTICYRTYTYLLVWYSKPARFKTDFHAHFIFLVRRTDGRSFLSKQHYFFMNTTDYTYVHTYCNSPCVFIIHILLFQIKQTRPILTVSKKHDDDDATR